MLQEGICVDCIHGEVVRRADLLRVVDRPGSRMSRGGSHPSFGDDCCDLCDESLYPFLKSNSMLHSSDQGDHRGAFGAVGIGLGSEARLSFDGNASGNQKGPSHFFDQTGTTLTGVPPWLTSTMIGCVLR